MDKLDIPIGTCLYINKHKIKVVKTHADKDSDCEQCHFTFDGQTCTSMLCSEHERKDGESVVFESYDYEIGKTYLLGGILVDCVETWRGVRTGYCANCVFNSTKIPCQDILKTPTRYGQDGHRFVYSAKNIKGAK